MPRAQDPGRSEVRRQGVLREVRVRSLESSLEGVMMDVF